MKSDSKINNRRREKAVYLRYTLVGLVVDNEKADAKMRQARRETGVAREQLAIYIIIN